MEVDNYREISYLFDSAPRCCHLNEWYTDPTHRRVSLPFEEFIPLVADEQPVAVEGTYLTLELAFGYHSCSIVHKLTFVWFVPVAENGVEGGHGSNVILINSVLPHDEVDFD